MLMKPNGKEQGERREPIASIRNRWRPLYSVLFVMQALPGMAFIIWAELVWTANESPVTTLKSILEGIVLVGGASIATTGTFSEVLDLMLGTRDAIRDAVNDWLEKRRDAAKAQGMEQGMEQGLSQAQEWYKRERAAREKGEPFDEPPPWDEATKTDD